jgi:GTP-binding protein
MTEKLNAEFIKSSTTLAQCPPPKKPEYAFIGRSNVGKSSLINMLTGIKGLAKTSSKPGKTQVINHFLVDDTWYLADLPGYGYAKVSQKSRDEWFRMIRSYLSGRESLMCVFVLVDSRVSPQANDLDFMRWLGRNSLPFVIILTKTDKLKPLDISQSQQALREALLKDWETAPPIYTSSSNSGLGRDTILQLIAETNAHFTAAE